MLNVAWLAGDDDESNDKEVAITGELGSVNNICCCCCCGGCSGCDCGCSAVDMAGGVISTFTSTIVSDLIARLKGSATEVDSPSEDSSVISWDVLIEFLINDSSSLGRDKGRGWKSN